MDKTLPNNTKALFEMIMENGDPLAGMRDRMWKPFDSDGKMKNGRKSSAESAMEQEDESPSSDELESTQTEGKPLKSKKEMIEEGDLRGLMDRFARLGGAFDLLLRLQ